MSLSWSKLLRPFAIMLLFAGIAIVFTPIIFPQWETADSARAYAYGHLRLGLWSAEQAQSVIEQSNQTQQFVRLMAGCIGLYVGLLVYFGFRTFRYRPAR